MSAQTTPQSSANQSSDKPALKRVALVVDGTCDLPAEWLKKWDVAVMYPYVNFGEESFLDDGIQLTKEDFYRRMAAGKGLPRTSAPAPGVAQELIAQQLKKAEQVVVFSLASQFSSIYNTFRLGTQDFDSARVTLVDTGQISMSFGWMVVAAAEAAERGAGPQEVIAAANSVRPRVRLYAAIDTMEYLRRSGRVNYMVASIGNLLQIKPIIDVKDGVVNTANRVRTMNKAVQALIDLAHAQAPLERLAVLHSNYPEGAANLQERLKDIAPADTVIVGIGTAIGTHVGPGCLGISTVTMKKSS